jgi:hypothetical protein
MKKCFAKLVQKYRRKYGEFEYLAVWELTKQGTPHIHVLQRGGFIPQTTLSEDWSTLTGSFIVDIRAVKSQEEVARYVTKYLTKSLGTISEVMTGLRVVQKSKNWILDKHKEVFDRESNGSSKITGWFFIYARPLEIAVYVSKIYGMVLDGDLTDEVYAFKGDGKCDLAQSVACGFQL